MFFLKTDKITSLLNYIFILYAISFIINPGMGRTLFYIMSVLWLLEGNFKRKFFQILNQKIFLFYILMIFTFLIKIYFSQSFDFDLFVDKINSEHEYILRQKYFFIALFIATSIKQKHMFNILLAFLLQLIFMALYSFSIKLGLLIGDKYGSINDPSVFLDHTHYSIVIAVGTISTIYLYLKERNSSYKILYIILFCTFFINLFIVKGRLGQLGLIASIIVMIIYYFTKTNKTKHIISLLLVLFVSISIIYNTSNPFKSRILTGLNDIKKVFYTNNYNSSWGVRLGFDIAVYDYLTNNINQFIFGENMNKKDSNLHAFISKYHTDKLVLLKYQHVHNQYFQSWLNGGLFGFIFFIMMLFYLLKLNTNIEEKTFIIGIFILFCVDSIGNLIFYRFLSLEIFGFILGYCLALEKNRYNKSLNNL